MRINKNLIIMSFSLLIGMLFFTPITLSNQYSVEITDYDYAVFLDHMNNAFPNDGWLENGGFNQGLLKDENSRKKLESIINNPQFKDKHLLRDYITAYDKPVTTEQKEFFYKLKDAGAARVIFTGDLESRNKRYEFSELAWATASKDSKLFKNVISDYTVDELSGFLISKELAGVKQYYGVPSSFDTDLKARYLNQEEMHWNPEEKKENNQLLESKVLNPSDQTCPQVTTEKIPTQEETTELIKAVIENNLTKVRGLLAKCPNKELFEIIKGHSLKSVGSGFYSKTMQKINDCAKINFQERVSGKTALVIAAENGNERVVQILLQKGADPNIKIKSGKTALELVAQRNDINIVKALLMGGATAFSAGIKAAENGIKNAELASFENPSEKRDVLKQYHEIISLIKKAENKNG